MRKCEKVLEMEKWGGNQIEEILAGGSTGSTGALVVLVAPTVTVSRSLQPASW